MNLYETDREFMERFEYSALSWHRVAANHSLLHMQRET